MNLNHDVQISPKEENYMNRSIDDFTDCIDFTKQYQKSCGLEEGNLDEPNNLNTSTTENKGTIESESNIEVHQEAEEETVPKLTGDKEESSPSNSRDNSLVNNKQNAKNEHETDYHPMEPDVSITVEESSLEKTINHVAKGIETTKCSTEKPLPDSEANEIVKRKLSKPKLVKKNHLKLPVNKHIKKKVSLFKFKNGKHLKKQTESFQYQGIQSNIKFKCYKCSYSDFSTISELQSHQRKCISGTPDFQTVNESASSFTSSSASNIKITRKVYLCSACGSYYENWNLFLHMKEMHKRHICLYCLGMFSQPDKLAQHLQTKHNVIEQNLSSTEEFLKFYRGPCYLICVSCEAMFSEQEDFYEHSCISSHGNSSTPCPLCGLQGAHFPTCRGAYSDRYLDPDSQKSHPALGTKLSIRKKKVKGSKKHKEVFHIVNNEHNGDMSVIVRKQNINDTSDATCESRIKEGSLAYKDAIDKSVMSTLRNSNEDLVSAKQYNEKMLQLYRPGKTTEKVISSIQSIEDSINRVVENMRAEEEQEKEYDGEFEDDEADMTFEEPEGEPSHYEKDTFSSSAELCSSTMNQQSDAKDSLQVEDNKLPKPDGGNEESLEKSQAEEVTEAKSPLKKDESQVLSESESTDSEKLTIAFDAPSEPVADKVEDAPLSSDVTNPEENIPTAPKETSYIFVPLTEEYDDIKCLIRELVKVSCWNCVYCSHAKRIALNGKQLVLHILAEHRFVTLPEDSNDQDKEESARRVIQRLKSSLVDLDSCYFNTDTYDSDVKDFWRANDRIYECFHCLYATYVHKELCSHNRKMHQKAMFLCIMCKSNFYTYSELLCHLCPGIYVSGQVINPDITYRCFLCDVDPLPSSFRLMVHLRRKHNSCDICFDQSSNQFQLSTHVWKHKLSHMCYRCGIAYRNKPDITKHLFWKHGTESVLCKKCLQKKWPHVYHFCVPPNSFICDECSVSLKSAVALKVHKRLHVGDYPYPCTKCEERFISRKLLGRHLNKHEKEETKSLEPEAPEPEERKCDDQVENIKNPDNPEVDVNGSDEVDKKPEKENKKSRRRKVLNDVFDLPPVNLSESDDSEQEKTDLTPKVFTPESPVDEPPIPNGYLNGAIQKEEPSPTQIVDGVWNNFQNYLVAKDMPKTFKPASPFKNMTLSRIKEIMLSDHDYHIIPNSSAQDGNLLKAEEKSKENTKKVGLDHDYCNNVPKNKSSCKSKQKTKPHREDASKSSSSDSSSDSDSSCSCGSNCSCTSGSSSSTSSNDSDSDSREKGKQKKNGNERKLVKEADPEPPTEVDISVHDVPNENLIRESDLDTDETETDEDFYDYNPAREANRILAEKRTQLLANLNGSDVVTSSPSIGTEKPASPVKKKAKFKKKRSQSRPSNASKSRKRTSAANQSLNKSRTSQFATETVADDGQPMVNPNYEMSAQHVYNRLRLDLSTQSPGDGDSKRPKRKRVPLKFYGFSSEDESESTPASRKREKAEHNTTTPASVSSAAVAPSPLDTSNEATPTVWNPHSKSSLSWRVEKSDASTPKVNPIKIRTSAGPKNLPTVEAAAPDGDLFQARRFDRNFQVNGGGNPAAQKGEKLYCFCQCPYDEVSEMIACDAEDCVIEWFHFECVGIMVPPKGSWYCPDCRKKLAAENEFLSPPTNEQNVN